MTDQETADKALADAAKARADADEAQAKADDAASGKTKEQVAADKAAQKADDLLAKANEAKTSASDAAAVPMTVFDAGVLAVVDPKLMAGDHLAQKFGNDPANPKTAPGIDMNANLVKMSRKTPDVPDLVYCEVPKEMVGDYARAGWNVA